METRSINQNQQNNQQQNQPKPGLSWTQPIAPQHTQPKIHEQKTTPPTNNPTPNNNKKWWIALAVVCVLAAFFVVGLRQKDSAKTGTATTTGTQAQTETQTSAMPNLVTVGSIKGLGVSPLQDAGSEVMVSVEEVSAPAWVVVYESNNGKPGNVLGAGYFTPTIISTSVPLLRDTQPGQTYFIGQTTDDGDKTYSMQKDAALTDAEGKLILVEFKTR